MKKLALLVLMVVMTSGISLAQTSGFTYQGKLADGGSPANGSYQFECKLFEGGPFRGNCQDASLRRAPQAIFFGV